MASSSSNIEEISATDSIDLLRTEQVGRVGVSVNGRPEIFPVSYSLDASNSILFRTGVGTKLSFAVNHQVVFEVDRVDAEIGTGWSVIVHGVAQHTERVAENDQRLISFRDDTPYLIRISHSSITGRWIQRST